MAHDFSPDEVFSGRSVRTTAKQLKTIHPQDYRTKLREWAGSALEEVGELSGALLKHAYYGKASEDHPLLKEEIRIAFTGADPVTG